VTKQALAFRRRQPELFGAEGAYTPVLPDGPAREHVVAFLRGNGSLTVVPRLSHKLAGRWEDTSLPIPVGRWRNELTGDEIEGGPTPLRAIFSRFPVALLSKQG
ncbi:malto-oligosyltrehalose synthase, partial [Singulisphaera rosea]